jgi:mycothione reductase
MEQFDLVVVGAGSGNSIITSAMDDWKIAMVEEWVFGGTCLNRGCIPTKMFVHAADTVLHIEHASALGVDAHVDQIRWLDIRDRVFGRIDPIAAGGTRYRTEECPNITVLPGRGRFIGERRLEAITPEGPVQIEGRQVVVAAGARPMVPDIPGLVETGFHTSDDLMRVDAVPEHLIVIGGGFIACELAHVFGALGSEITFVLRHDRLLRGEDDDISAAITHCFAQRFGMHHDVSVTLVERVAAGVRVHLSSGAVVEGSDILLATGRVPNSDTVDAAAGGLALHPDGRIVVDDTQATNVPGVWALGDISSPHMLKHVANHEARVVAHNLVHPESPRRTDHRAVPHAVFTNPQIAAVGLTEREARDAGLDIMVAVHHYRDVAYGWALEDTQSFCKLIADPHTRTLIGAHIIGPQSSSLIQQLIQSVRYGRTIDEIAVGQYYIHPALGEVVENALLKFPGVTQ